MYEWFTVHLAIGWGSISAVMQMNHLIYSNNGETRYMRIQGWHTLISTLRLQKPQVPDPRHVRHVILPGLRQLQALMLWLRKQPSPREQERVQHWRELDSCPCLLLPRVMNRLSCSDSAQSYLKNQSIVQSFCSVPMLNTRERRERERVWVAGEYYTCNITVDRWYYSDVQ